jgi:hypothetical protein
MVDGVKAMGAIWNGKENFASDDFFNLRFTIYDLRDITEFEMARKSQIAYRKLQRCEEHCLF